jgi:hypothetical protein
VLERSCFGVRNEGHWVDALFSGIGGVVEERLDFPWTRKYVVDILRRFEMMDCRPMSMPMTTNLKKLHASESELVDPTLYRQLIGSLMYLVNTRPNICFVVNTLSQLWLSRGGCIGWKQNMCSGTYEVW